MNADDTAACQSVEVFEADPALASDAELRAQYPSLVAGQVGLRCIHCSSDPLAAYTSLQFPSSIESLADSVQMLSDRHLSSCGMAPAPAREAGQRASAKRRRNDQERGSSWQDDERSRVALRDWCFRFCQRLGIIDKGPNGTGIIFGQQPTERPRSIPGMMGPMGGDPHAQTPSLRRRDRPMPREGGEYRAGGGYDSAYVQGGEGNYGAVDTEGYDTSQNPGGYHQQQMHPFDMSSNFPFYQEPNGSWSCRYCSNIHPQYRDPHSAWFAPNHAPPPPQFVDQHLSMCRAYHQALPPQQMPPSGPQQAQYPYMTPQFHGGFGGPQRQGGWDGPGPGQAQGSQSQSNPYPRPQAAIDHHSTPAQMHPFPHTPHQMSASPKFGESASRGKAPTSMTPLSSAGPPRQDIAESAVRHAIDFLSASDREISYTPLGDDRDAGQLVLDEDKLLLTDYFFYLMKQLRLCRFSEADRKTRGGKREKIQIGFGGLQCIHCIDANNARKFFWSNVDRLANSFAEIPGHVLKCRHCPQQTKDALYQLKQFHPEQMARLPRGSQKVFFRRMWRRLHDEDPQAKSPDQPTSSGPSRLDIDVGAGEPKSPAEAKTTGQDTSPSGTTGSDESILLLQRSTKEAAKALADSASMSLPPSPTSRVLLAIPEDKEWLSDTDCFIRRQIEVFCASNDDVQVARHDRKFPVHEGQVGIRCIHCSLTKQGTGAHGSAVAYPFSISGIYESVREFQRLHLDSCENLPAEMRTKLADLKGSTSLSSVLRKYYVLAAKALGLKDTRDGIRAGAESVPLGSQAAFAFSEGGSVSDEMRRSTMPYSEAIPVESRKRKQEETPEASGSAKRNHS
jgi:hypothetical protein